jgi:hypothetical protein
MFRGGRGGKGAGKGEPEKASKGGSKKAPVANRLSGEAKPNRLSWTGADAVPADEFEDELEDEYEDELEDEDLDDEEEEEGDTRTRAERRAALDAELARQAEEFGLTGTDPIAAYGPNGEAVAAVLDDLAAMRPGRMERVAEAHDLVDSVERGIVRRELEHRHYDGRYRDELALAEQMVSDWLSAEQSSGANEIALAREVAEAARDAVDALILEKDLDAADFDLLYGPWADAMAADDEDESDGSDDEDDEPEEDEDGPFGPGTPLVQELLDRLAKLDPDQLQELGYAWNGLSRKELHAAHKAVKEAIEEDDTWRDQVKAAQDEVSAWADAPHPPRPGRRGDMVPPDPSVVRAAVPAAVDAVTALVLADLLEPEDAEVLYSPWAEIVGEPELPEFEEDDEEDDED